MGLKWKFQRGGGGGGGFKPKNFSGRGMDILWNNTILKSAHIRSEC